MASAVLNRAMVTPAAVIAAGVGPGRSRGERPGAKTGPARRRSLCNIDHTVAAAINAARRSFSSGKVEQSVAALTSGRWLILRLFLCEELQKVLPVHRIFRFIYEFL